MSEGISFQAVDADHGVAIWNRTLIQIWRGRVSESAVLAMNSAARRFVLEPGAATCLFIVEAASPPPEGAARKALATFSLEIAAQMVLAVVVAEGGGFRAALVRGVGLALTTLMPHRVPFKFVNSVADAWPLIAPHLRGTTRLEQMQNAVDQLRDAISSFAQGTSPGPPTRRS